METRRGKIHLRAVAVATVAMIASIGVFGLVADIAGSQGATDHSDLEHHHGFTGPGNVADWPPRPVGASELTVALEVDELPVPSAAVFETPEPTTLEEQLRESGGGGVLTEQPDAPDAANGEPEPTPEPFISDDPLAQALGADWVHISSEEPKTGKDGSTPGQETYFSRSNNQTVFAVQWPGSVEVITFAAAEVQPIVSKVEGSQAAELGRAWLIERGETDVESLEGFAIRAFNDGELYPVRMVYITYATSWFDDPIHSALVDMTNLTVVEGGRL